MKMSVLPAFLCAALVAATAGSFAAPAEKAADKKDASKKKDAKAKPINALCPIMKEDVDPKVVTAYKGKTVAFCCESCIDDFKKDPEKYMKQIPADNKKAEEAKKAKEKDKGKSTGKSEGKSEKAEGKSAKPVNELCVVHPDDAVDPMVTTTYKGKLIGFCCDDCLKKFDSNPDQYAAKLK